MTFIVVAPQPPVEDDRQNNNTLAVIGTIVACGSFVLGGLSYSNDLRGGGTVVVPVPASPPALSCPAPERPPLFVPAATASAAHRVRLTVKGGRVWS